MRLYITSDTHNSIKLKGFKDAGQFNAIVHCGDITNYGIGRNLSSEEDYRAINFYNSLKTKMYYVPGNHDCGFGNRDIIGGNSTNVLNKVVNIGGYSLYGFSLSPCYDMPELYTTWDNLVIDLDIERNYYLSAPYADIIISHCPPKYCGLDFNLEGVSIGSDGLYRYILKHQPKYVFCGHVHKNKVMKTYINNTLIYNVATNKLILDL